MAAVRLAWAKPLAARPPERSSVLLGLLTLAMSFVVLYPIGLILSSSVLVAGADGSAHLTLDAWRRAFTQPGLLESIVNTAKVVVAVQAISFPLAILLAWLLARTDLPGSSWLEVGFWLSFLMPALGTTTGWILLLAPDYGLLNQLALKLGLPAGPFNVYSYWGIVFAHLATYSISIKVMLLTPAFRNLDASLEEASRVCGANSLRSLWHVGVPLLTPLLLVTFLMSLIRGLEAFEIELVLGTPIGFAVYSTKIYQLLRSSPPDYASATVLGALVLALLIPLVALERWTSTRRSYVTVTGQQRRGVLELGAWRWPAFGLVLAFVLFLTALPISFQAMGSLMTLFGFFDVPQVWTTRHWERALADPTLLRGLANSVVLGAATVVAALVVYSLVAYCSVRLRQRWRVALDLLAWLPFAIPGVILGLGYLRFALAIPLVRPLYGTIWVLVFVCWLAAMTLGVQICKSGILQLSVQLEEAGYVVGGSWLRTFRTIVVPLLSPTLLVLAVMVFAVTVRQVSTIVLLTTGPSTPLAVLQLELLYGAELGPAAVVGTLIVLLSSGVALAARLLGLRVGARQ
ncbi:MAG TPA: iron ABC transporter permease [Chloroflexota bacterium]